MQLRRELVGGPLDGLPVVVQVVDEGQEPTRVVVPSLEDCRFLQVVAEGRKHWYMRDDCESNFSFRYSEAV